MTTRIKIGYTAHKRTGIVVVDIDKDFYKIELKDLNECIPEGAKVQHYGRTTDPVSDEASTDKECECEECLRTFWALPGTTCPNCAGVLK